MDEFILFLAILAGAGAVVVFLIAMLLLGATVWFEIERRWFA